MTSTWSEEERTAFIQKANAKWYSAGRFARSGRGDERVTKTLRFIERVSRDGNPDRGHIDMRMFVVEVDGVVGLACYAFIDTLGNLLYRDMPCNVICSVIECKPDEWEYPGCPLFCVRTFQADIKFAEQAEGPTNLKVHS